MSRLAKELLLFYLFIITIMTLPFKITKWSAWSPALRESSDWILWANKQSEIDPFTVSDVTAPAVGFLPIGMRKRLSDLCKLVLYLSHNTLQERNDLRIVMASRYGECELTLELLETVGRKEISSPMVFSRSVMNSSLGLFSIFSKNFQPSTCVSAMENTFSIGLLEALAQLYSYDQPILFLYVEEKVLDVFKNYAEQPPVSYGASFLLEKGEQVYADQQTCLEFLKKALRAQAS